MTTPDPLTRLEKVTQDVYGYLDQRAREIAEPLIAVAEEAAASRVSQVEHDLRMSRDLVAELRRQCAALVKQVECRPAPVSERTDPRHDRIRSAAVRLPGVQRLPGQEATPTSLRSRGPP